jgi:ABC-type glutathione transport system ATPase component
MALVGRPPIVLLDEPTTGLDPLARRALWRALTDAMEQGQSIILTSHSMDEVDALATKMAIMVNGEFKCFGTPQHLKTKFGKGGSITVAATDKVAALEFLTSKFPRGESSDDHSNTFTYSIAEDVPLSELFTVGPPLPSCNVARTPDAVDPWPHFALFPQAKKCPPQRLTSTLAPPRLWRERRNQRLSRTIVSAKRPSSKSLSNSPAIKPTPRRGKMLTELDEVSIHYYHLHSSASYCMKRSIHLAGSVRI